MQSTNIDVGGPCALCAQIVLRGHSGPRHSRYIGGNVRLPDKKPPLAESLQGLRNRCNSFTFPFDPDGTALAGEKLKDILDDLLMLLQDEALQSANAGKPLATTKARKSAKQNP